ncbi:MAG: glutaredoxin domain-containing protein [Gaiellaceae bacterium]
MDDLPKRLPELWQTEWCPASRRLGQRLTELELDYVVRHVPVEPADRTALRAATGVETIPVLVPENGPPVVGEDPIRAWLDAHVAEPDGAEAHRLKAAKSRRRYLEEECECLQPATH